MRPDKETLEPMTLTSEQLCRLLGISRSTFYLQRRALDDRGFPAKRPVVGRYRRAADEERPRKTSGLRGSEPEESFEI